MPLNFANLYRTLAVKLSVFITPFFIIKSFFLLFFISYSFAIPNTPQSKEILDKYKAGESIAYPQIRNQRDRELQKKLRALVDEMNLTHQVKAKKVGIALVDISDELNPKYADINGDTMMYAASLPKIAILFGLFKQIEMGVIEVHSELLKQAHAMIRTSSNTAATDLLNLVGIKYLANLLQSPEFLLYEKKYGGGLWVGKVYDKQDALLRDPINNLSHGASPLKVAEFYYLLATNRLVNEALTEQMKEIMTDPGIHHKFVKGLDKVCPAAKVYRKSGTWQNWHSDSAIVSHGGKSYIAVGLIQDEKGGEWLTQMIKRFDQIIFSEETESGCVA